MTTPRDMKPITTPDVLPDLIRIDHTRRSLWVRIALVVGGSLCLVLGIVGWLVPVVTGVPFYVLGALLLGMASPPLGKRINAWESRLPERCRLWLRPRIRAARRRAEKERAATGAPSES